MKYIYEHVSLSLKKIRKIQNLDNFWLSEECITPNLQSFRFSGRDIFRDIRASTMNLFFKHVYWVHIAAHAYTTLQNLPIISDFSRF